jgi:ferredoxin
MAVKHSLYHEAGQALVDQERCTLCGLCVQTCPAEVLSIEEPAVRQNNEVGFGCISCGHCMMVCPQECITVSGRNLVAEDLKPLPLPEERADARSFQALLASRRSVRRFSERPVESELLEQIVAMASSAPMGIPPWDVGVTTVAGFDAVRELAGEVVVGYQGLRKIFRPGLLKLMRPFIGRSRTEQFRDFILPLAETYIETWGEGRDTVFWGAPAVMLFHHTPFAGEADAVIACTYAMLAAESLGLGSCMIGGAPPVIQRNKALCARLDIPEGSTPALALILGYSAVPFKRAITRRFLQEQGIASGIL